MVGSSTSWRRRHIVTLPASKLESEVVFDASMVDTVAMPQAQDFADRYRVWRESRSVLVMLTCALLWAGLMGLLAQVRIPLPFTPVPFTMQVFGVLLGGVILGTAYGTLAQALYVGIGIAGVPWFQGYHGGWEYFLGPTGGYLLAYPIAALFVGSMASRAPVRPAARSLVAMLVGLMVVYACGMTWLAWVLDVSIARAFALGVAPFIVVDVLKAAGAAALARPFLTR